MRKLHKITSSGIVAAVVAFSALTTQAQNLLVNPGFESSTGFTANPIHLSGQGQGWATFGASQSDMTASIASPHGGSYSLLVVNNYANNWNPQGAYQIVGGITPGDKYTFSSWYLTDTGTTYGTPVALQLGFGNWNGTNFNDLGSVEGGVGTNSNWGFGGGTGTGPTPPGSIPTTATAANPNPWYQGSLTATAPAGATAAVVYLFFMDNGQATTEQVYFDDTSLTAVVPEPTSLALLGLAVPCYFMLRRRR